MSIFPTEILLATDGSRDAELAAEATVDLSKRTGVSCMSATPGGSYRTTLTPVSLPISTTLLTRRVPGGYSTSRRDI